jgi:phenylpyruvate tautomerase
VSIDNERNGKLTTAITAELEKELGVADNRGYFLFTDLPASNVGFQKTTFQNIFSNM